MMLLDTSSHAGGQRRSNRRRCPLRVASLCLGINEKVMVVVLPGPDLHELKQVKESRELKQLRKKHKIKLFHVGKQDRDSVSYGYDEEQKQFSYPAIDYGGLTNLLQSPGEEISFPSDDEFLVHRGETDVTNVAISLFNTCRNLHCTCSCGSVFDH